MYLYVKAIHVFAVVTLIGGMLAMALVLRSAIASPEATDVRRFGEAILRWDGLVTTPALAIVWMAGFTMAFGAGWDSSLWLLVKMIPALALTGLHSLEGPPVHPLFGAAAFAILATFAAIAWLAVVKPF
jgi:protoporphyrinogen IX oxidase